MRKRKSAESHVYASREATADLIEDTNVPADVQIFIEQLRGCDPRLIRAEKRA